MGKYYSPRLMFIEQILKRKSGEWPKIVVVEGSEDRHSSGEWLSDKAIRSGEVELTRASNLMRLKF